MPIDIMQLSHALIRIKTDPDQPGELAAALDYNRTDAACCVCTVIRHPSAKKRKKKITLMRHINAGIGFQFASVGKWCGAVESPLIGK